MDWMQFAIFVGSTVGLFFWNRAESRNDMRMMLGMLNEMKEEMKDFHGRLERLDADFKAHLMYGHEGKNVK